MKTNTAARRLGLTLIVALALGGCGDDSVFGEPEDTLGTFAPDDTMSTYAPGGTGTVPIPGPADWLEWSPAEAPGAAAEADLVAALEELGMAMIIPTSAPPIGGQATATFNSQSLGYGSGQTFPGTTSISLNVVGEAGGHVVVSTPAGEMTTCSEGAAPITLRGDATACALDEGEYFEVWWDEGGRSFRAAFFDGLTLDQGLTWLETWRMLP
jgi:hypothetical protein